MMSLGSRERTAIRLAMFVHLGRNASASLLIRQAVRRGLSTQEIDTLAQGGAPRDRELRLVVAATWLLLDRHGLLAGEDMRDLADAGIYPSMLQSILHVLNAERVEHTIGVLNPLVASVSEPSATGPDGLRG